MDLLPPGPALARDEVIALLCMYCPELSWSCIFHDFASQQSPWSFAAFPGSEATNATPSFGCAEVAQKAYLGAVLSAPLQETRHPRCCWTRSSFRAFTGLAAVHRVCLRLPRVSESVDWSSDVGQRVFSFELQGERSMAGPCLEAFDSGASVNLSLHS